ncbi:MAG: alcohol dehydrogenase catalytic domain-containing protein [Chloroflexi bacterium]|nr:alcohol dehydrogenase catalytic domain-containing protein [Chloroflexota bacterium]
MATTGRLATFYGPGEPLRLVERPVPEPEPGAALVRISLANVCGSDLHMWRGEMDLRKLGRALPRNLGHEMCGRIAALGEGVTTDSAGAPLAVGDRVVYRYTFACGRCQACLVGMTRACPHQARHLATTCEVWPYFKGAFGDYTYLFPGHVVFKVPDALSDGMVAGINCAFSQVICGLDVARLRLGETVVIQGAGGLGIYATAAARELGAGRVIVIDGVQERLDLAAAFGADELIDLRELPTPEGRIERVKALTEGWGAHVVMDLAGSIGAIPEGLQMVGNGGRYVEIGNISPDMTFPMDPARLIPRNVSFLPVGFYEPSHLQQALDLMLRTRDRYPYDRVVSDVFPLDQVNEVLAEQDKGRITRAALAP